MILLFSPAYIPLRACSKSPISAANGAFGLRLCAAQLTSSGRGCSFRSASARLQNRHFRYESEILNRLLYILKYPFYSFAGRPGCPQQSNFNAISALANACRMKSIAAAFTAGRETVRLVC
jgi:hypothetical protein